MNSVFCCFSWENSTKCSRNPGLVNEFSASPWGRLNWTGPIANSSERGSQNWSPEVFDQMRCSRTFECRICPEWQRIGHDKSVFRKECSSKRPHQKEQNEGGIFLEQSFLLGTVRPPDIFRIRRRGCSRRGTSREFVADCRSNLRNIAGISFRASHEGCAKLSQICR